MKMNIKPIDPKKGFIKLHPATKKVWVEALRSGKYKQGTGDLILPAYDPDTGESLDYMEFCCLGVLGVCKRFSQEALGGHSMLTDTMVKDAPYNKRLEAVLKQECEKPIGYVGFSDLEQLLAYHNDEGATFKQIANWIEKNL